MTCHEIENKLRTYAPHTFVVLLLMMLFGAIAYAVGFWLALLAMAGGLAGSIVYVVFVMWAVGDISICKETDE